MGDPQPDRWRSGELLLVMACAGATLLATIAIPLLFVGVARPEDLDQAPRTILTLADDLKLPLLAELARAFAVLKGLRYALCATALVASVCTHVFIGSADTRLLIHSSMLSYLLLAILFQILALLALIL
jgi:hypothetical protein